MTARCRMTDNALTPRQTTERAKAEGQTPSSPVEATKAVPAKQDARSSDRGGRQGWWQTVRQCWHDQDPELTLRERLIGWWKCIQRKWLLVGAIAVAISVVTAVVLFVIGFYSDWTGRPAQQLVRDLVPQRPFTTPAAENEYLIIVTHFKDESEARNLDVRNVLAEAITAELPPNSNARVAVADSVTPADEKEARSIGKRYHATIILWGHYLDNRIDVNLTPLVQLHTPIQDPEPHVISQSVDELAVFVNELAAGPVRWLSLLTLGQASYLRGLHHQAIPYFDAALGLLGTMEPDEHQVAATYYYRGNAYANRGEYDRAIGDYDKAIKFWPDLAEAYNNRGIAYAQRGEYDRAIKDYDRAIALQPHLVEAYSNRGLAYDGKGEYDRAIEDFDQATALQPEDAEAYSGRGTAYAHKGEHDKAIADYDHAIELQPDFAEAYCNRGLDYA